MDEVLFVKSPPCLTYIEERRVLEMKLWGALKALRLLSDRRLSDRRYSKKVVIPTKALETLLFRPAHRDRSFPDQGINISSTENVLATIRIAFKPWSELV